MTFAECLERLDRDGLLVWSGQYPGAQKLMGKALREKLENWGVWSGLGGYADRPARFSRHGICLPIEGCILYDQAPEFWFVDKERV
jgi:hypothetical protein